MITGILHLHVTIVSLFTLLYLAKVYLMLANKTEALVKLRSKTKIADMVLGSLIIITGVFLTIKTPVIETFLIVKIVLVIVSIPIGIVAMKKANKPMAVCALLIYFYVFAVAKTDSLTFKKDAYVMPASTTASTVGEGEVIFTEKCAVCHGTDGKLMLNGAKDLSISKLTSSEISEMVKSGKGSMPGFNGVFNEEQLASLTTYVEGLKK